MISTQTLNALFNGARTLAELETATGAPRKHLVKAVQVLKRHELACIVSRGEYALTELGRARAQAGHPVNPGQGTRPRTRTVGIRERAWWHFRAHKVATLKELIGTHADGHESDPVTNLYKYVNSLEKAGILTRSQKRVPARQSRGLVQWSLARDLGKKAPVWREREKVIYDPNSGALYPIQRTAPARGVPAGIGGGSAQSGERGQP